jgi:hypothetical protein
MKIAFFIINGFMIIKPNIKKRIDLMMRIRACFENLN